MVNISGLHFSKTIIAGCLVQLRGNKICRAGKRTIHPLGVFQQATQRTFIVIEKEKINHVHTSTPMGIQTKGPCLIRGI